MRPAPFERDHTRPGQEESQEGLTSLARAGNDHLRRKTCHSYVKSPMATPSGSITFTFIKSIIIAHYVPRKIYFIYLTPTSFN